jgi:hypothetical protein
VRRPTRTRSALAAAVAAGALLAVPLAGCGEKSEPATTGPVVAQSTSPVEGGTTTTTTPQQSDDELAAAAARAYLTSTDAEAVCDNGITPELLKQAYGDREGCIAGRKPASLATSAAIGKVIVRGSSAEVPARATGGQYGHGKNLTLTVVRDGEAWRVSKVGPAK